MDARAHSREDEARSGQHLGECGADREPGARARAAQRAAAAAEQHADRRLRPDPLRGEAARAVGERQRQSRVAPIRNPAWCRGGQAVEVAPPFGVLVGGEERVEQRLRADERRFIPALDERAGGGARIGDDAVEARRHAAQAAGGCAALGELGGIERVHALHPGQRLGELDRRRRVQEQVELELRIRAVVAVRVLERLDQMAHGLVEEPVQEKGRHGSPSNKGARGKTRSARCEDA